MAHEEPAIQILAPATERLQRSGGASVRILMFR